jgi:hypothetical protein
MESAEVICPRGGPGDSFCNTVGIEVKIYTGGSVRQGKTVSWNIDQYGRPADVWIATTTLDTRTGAVQLPDIDGLPQWPNPYV